MVLVRPRLAARAAAILAAATPGKRRLASAATRALRRVIRLDVRPGAEQPPPKGYSAAKTPRGLLPRVPLSRGTTAVRKVAALSVKPTATATAPALTAPVVGLRLRTGTA